MKDILFYGQNKEKLQIILSDSFRSIKAYISGFALIMVFLLSACEKKATQPVVRVAVAANFAEPIRLLKTDFEEKNNCTIDLVVGSSGTLTNQILQGAPYDLFFSADRAYSEALYKEGLSKRPPQVYALGMLVLSSSSKMNLSSSICDLLDQKGFRVGIANPDLAPYGKAAEEFLKSQDCWTEIKERLVYAQNVNQLNQYLFSGMVDLGFTSYSSTYLEGFDLGFVPVDTPEASLEQTCILLDGKVSGSRLAAAFYNYMLSDQVRQKLSALGYGQPLH